MTGETSATGRLVMAIVAVLVGLFLIFVAPFVTVSALSPALHRLVEVHQVQQPKGVWDTPVGILTFTFHLWMLLYVFAGAALIVIANPIRTGETWARPLALALHAIPSIGGLTMVIPWTVLVMIDTQGNKNPAAGLPPALSIMGIGLLAYFITLLTEKADWKTKLAQAVVFAWIGVTGGFVWMNAQHGVRYFLAPGSMPFIDPNASNPELFLGGFVIYTSVLVMIVAIGLLGARKRLGYQLALIAGIVATAAEGLAFVDRLAAGAPSALDWLRGAGLAGVMVALLLIPFFKNRVMGEATDASPQPSTARPVMGRA